MMSLRFVLSVVLNTHLANGEVYFQCIKKNYFKRMCVRKDHARFTKKSVAKMEVTDNDVFNIVEYDKVSTRIQDIQCS